MPSHRYHLRSNRHHYNFPQEIAEFNGANPDYFYAIICPLTKTQEILKKVPYSYHITSHTIQPGPVRIAVDIIGVPYNYTQYQRLNNNVTLVLGENEYRFANLGQFIHKRSKHHLQIFHHLRRGTVCIINI